MAYALPSATIPTASFFTSPPKVSSQHFTIPRVPCKTTNDDQDRQNPTARRNILFGLVGICCTTGLGNFGHGKVAQAAETATKNMVVTPVSVFPLDLDKVVSTSVPRPKKSRSKQEKEDEEEVLVIEGIDFDRNEFVKFDVFVNDEDDDTSPSGRPENNTEFAGSFVNVPHRTREKTKTSLRLAINDLLEDLKAEDDDSLVVTLVPRSGGKQPINIAGVKIEYAQD